MGAPEDQREPESLQDMADIVTELKGVFYNGKTRSLDYRMHQLATLAKMLKDMKEDYMAAVAQDMKKPGEEVYFTDLRYADHEIGHAIRHLEDWMKPTTLKTDLAYVADDVHLYPEPRGVVIIFGAWNYPLQLVVIPLIGAIAAGCCAVIKPSELVPHTTAVMVRYFRDYMDSECYRILQGGPDVAIKLMEQRWDHVFFTGSTAVGKIVAAKAGENLISTTLELGGKSPTMVDETVNLDVTARRICWGKFMNTGQICIAPDYILVHRSVKDKLIAALKKRIVEFYTSDPASSADYGRICNVNSYHRLVRLLGSGKIVHGGQVDEQDLFIAPTIVECLSWDDEIMQDEIFGPILPIMAYDDFPTLVSILKRREKPLVVYLFTENKERVEMVRREISSGTLSVNDCIQFACITQLPFGGVGYSGQGRYHGKASFDAFTNLKSVHAKNLKGEFLNDVRYPPFCDSKLKTLLYEAILYNSETELSKFRQIARKSVKYVVLAGILSFFTMTYQSEISGLITLVMSSSFGE